jgi:hypothetical protein
LTRKVKLTCNGLDADTVYISYTNYHRNVELPTLELKQAYEKTTKECGNKAHLDTAETHFNVADLTRMVTSTDAKGSNWYKVREVNVYVESGFVIWTALNGKGDRVMSTIIPIGNVQEVNIHYKNPTKYVGKHKPENGLQIHDFFETEADALR